MPVAGCATFATGAGVVGTASSERFGGEIIGSGGATTFGSGIGDFKCPSAVSPLGIAMMSGVDSSLLNVLIATWSGLGNGCTTGGAIGIATADAATDGTAAGAGDALGALAPSTAMMLPPFSSDAPRDPPLFGGDMKNAPAHSTPTITT